MALPGARPSLDLHHGLGDVHSELLSDGAAVLQSDPLLLASLPEECEVTQPYIDPAFRNPSTYGNFLQRSNNLGILEFGKEDVAYLGVFLL